MNNFTIPEKVYKLSQEQAVNFDELLSQAHTETIATGQVWSTYSAYKMPEGQVFTTETPRLVVILAVGGGGLTVAPISIDINMATEFDLVLTGDFSPTVFDFMIEVWNETPAHEQLLRKYIASLTEQASYLLSELYKAFILDEEIPGYLREYIGVAMHGLDDPRILFQSEEIEALKYLARASTSILADIEETTEIISRDSVLGLRLPQWLRFSDIFKAPLPQVAYAKSTSIEEDEDLLILDRDHDPQVVLELIRDDKRRHWYYLVRYVSPELTNAQARVVLTVNDERMLTETIVLDNNMKLHIDDGSSDFDYSEIHSVFLEIVE